MENWLKRIIDHWPLIVCMASFIALGARADAQITDHGKRLGVVESSVKTSESRLSSIETWQSLRGQQLDRIEQKLDALNEASR